MTLVPDAVGVMEPDEMDNARCPLPNVGEPSDDPRRCERESPNGDERNASGSKSSSETCVLELSELTASNGSPLTPFSAVYGAVETMIRVAGVRTPCWTGSTIRMLNLLEPWGCECRRGIATDSPSRRTMVDPREEGSPFAVPEAALKFA